MGPSHRLLPIVSLCLACGCDSEPDPERKYARTPDGFLMVLREGDDAFQALTELALEEKIGGATFTGFGFGHATFGYFDQQKKEFDKKEVREVELAHVTGSVAWKDGKPSLHAHAVAADRSFSAQGGHLLGFQVGRGSLELQIVTRRPPLTRQRDDAIGADVLVLPR